jgi:hypothetical protein
MIWRRTADPPLAPTISYPCRRARDRDSAVPAGVRGTAVPIFAPPQGRPLNVNEVVTTERLIEALFGLEA